MFAKNKFFGGSVRHVISLSGGKDSLAVWLFARERNIDATIVFADTGHEHPLTYEYISLLEQKLGPVIRRRVQNNTFMKHRNRWFPATFPFWVCISGKAAFPAPAPGSVR